jgi:ubiquinone/menaquinone biosynthesis C-methylase UbiE
MRVTRFLSHSQAARFYDVLGARLDTQAFYEDAVLHELVGHLDLNVCQAVVEFGCGTGRLAAELLEMRLSSEATYLGLDVSGTLIDLTKRRLDRWGGRAAVRQCNGAPAIDAADGAFDRFSCTYVLDLLPDVEIRAVLDEAHRVLKSDGLIGLASLTNGPTLISGLVSTMWRGLHHLSPWLLGGCRPIAIRPFLSNSGWRVAYANIVVRFGIASEMVVAKPVPTPQTSSS